MAEIRKATLFTNEYPPNVYGGAGVHVEYLSRALARRIAVEVRCFGEQRSDDPNLTVRGYPRWAEAKANTDPRFAGALDAFHRSLAMAKDTIDADVVHCHTWYTDMGGLLASRLWDVPFVLTIHSLEPLRPWKVEQLGNGYHLSTWMERTAIEHADAIIAVSRQTREDVLRLFDVQPARVHVIHNGIDPDRVPADRRHGRARAAWRRSGHALRAVRRPHHAPEGHHPPRRRHPRDRPRPAGRALRRRARHAGDRPRDGGARGRGPRQAAGRDLDQRDAAADRRDPALLARGGVLLPLGLRAVRHHQPRGHGLRDRGGRLRASAAFRRWWCPRRPACWSI